MEEHQPSVAQAPSAPTDVGVLDDAASIMTQPVPGSQIGAAASAVPDATPPAPALPAKANPIESIEPMPEEAPPDQEEDDVELPDLSPEHIAFLSSPRYLESVRLAQSQFALSDDDISFLAEMDHAVLGGMINIGQYVEALRGEFLNLNEKEKNELIGLLLAYRYIPYDADMRPNATQIAAEQGIPLPPVPYYRMYTKPLTYRGASHEVARMAGIEFMGQAQERLRDIIISRIKGIRTAAQVEEQLVRPQEQGGLGLNEATSHAAREAIDDLISRAKLMTEEDYASWLNMGIRNAREQKKTVASVASPAPASATPLAADEEDEIRKIASSMPKPVREMNTALDRAVQAIADRLPWKTQDEYLRRRLANGISTRLRDVRSRNELFMKLMRDDNVGGLGMNRETAERVIEDIEAGYREFHDQVAGEEEQLVERQRMEQERKVKERKLREAEEHARWFEEKVKARQTKKAEQKNVLEQFRNLARGQTSPIHPVEAKDAVKERAAFGKLVPAAPSSGAKDVKASSPIKVSVETARMREAASSTARPRIEDVTPPHAGRLAGPLQEIGSMTIDRFRRLGKTPQESVARLTDLIALLERESFEKRIAGIQAWKGSPMHKQYLALVAESFTAKKPMNELLAEKAKAGELVPSAEEVQAILAMNKAVHM